MILETGDDFENHQAIISSICARGRYLCITALESPDDSELWLDDFPFKHLVRSCADTLVKLELESSECSTPTVARWITYSWLYPLSGISDFAAQEILTSATP